MLHCRACIKAITHRFVFVYNESIAYKRITRYIFIHYTETFIL